MQKLKILKFGNCGFIKQNCPSKIHLLIIDMILDYLDGPKKVASIYVTENDI